jgi:hypothetical protein
VCPTLIRQYSVDTRAILDDLETSNSNSPHHTHQLFLPPTPCRVQKWSRRPYLINPETSKLQLRLSRTATLLPIGAVTRKKNDTPRHSKTRYKYSTIKEIKCLPMSVFLPPSNQMPATNTTPHHMPHRDTNKQILASEISNTLSKNHITFLKSEGNNLLIY